MPFFENAVGTTVHEGTFIDVRGNYHNHISKAPDGMKALYKRIATGALYNSEERFDAPRCHPETRIAVQNDIMSWIRQDESSGTKTSLLWLTGPAGAGKSAIKQTISEQCHTSGLLAASFFFSYQYQERNNKSRLIPTIAYQVAQRIPAVREAIVAAVAQDRSIFNQDLNSQVTKLLLEPALAARGSSDAWPRVILIDGLDECDGEAHQLDVLRTFHEAICRGLPFRIAFAGRPEATIRRFFEELGASVVHKIVLDENYHPDADIELYLRSEFNTIRRNHHIEDPTWPPDHVITTLVERASGQFIYASTVSRFVDDPAGLPFEHLDLVLQTNVESETKNPFRVLDALFTTILDRCPNPGQSAFALAAINVLSRSPSNLPHPSTKFNASDVVRFLQWSSTDISRILGSLHSLLHIPPKDRSEVEEYRLHHKTIVDFLENAIRSNHLHIPVAVLYTKLSIQVLRVGNTDRPIRHDWFLFNDSFHYKLYSISLAQWVVLAIPLDSQTQEEFLNSAQIDSWVRMVVQREDPAILGEMYKFIHAKDLGCSRILCSKICKAWRKAIVKECERSREDWVLPSTLQLFLSKFTAPTQTITPTSEVVVKVPHIFVPRSQSNPNSPISPTSSPSDYHLYIHEADSTSYTSVRMSSYQSLRLDVV